MDEYRFLQSPRHEAPMNSLVSPQRNGRMPSQDLRASLPRRFTTDSGRVPTLSSLPTTQAQEYASVLPPHPKYLEKKKAEYEKLREQKRRFEAEMLRIEQQERELREDLAPSMGLPGHQSEPTTPPEYRDTNTGFPNMFSRPNRYSMSSLVSPPGLPLTRPGRSGSVLMSPQSNIMPSRYHDDPLPYRSVPTTRRNSDEAEKEEALRQDPTSHLSTAALNRYSMPVTRRGNIYDNIDQTNTTGFLFRDDDPALDAGVDAGEGLYSSFQSQKGSSVLASTVAAMELAGPLGGGEGTTAAGGWGNISRHRQQQSLSNMPSSMTDSMGALQSDSNPIGSRSYRHSIDLNQQFKESTGEYTPTSNISPSTAQVMSTPPKLQSSFSANDIPTVKTMSNTTPSSANAHAQQHFHNHNASIGRIPPGAMKRHSRDLSGDSHTGIAQSGGTFPSIQSQLQGNAPSFGPIASSQAPIQTTVPAGANSALSPSGGPYQYYPGYNQAGSTGAYNMPMLAMGMQNMGLNGYQPQNYTGYSALYQSSVQPRDSQQRVMQQRRAQNDDAMNRYTNMNLEQVGGSIYEMCKDQHGCRFLQKQLENRDPGQIHMIWVETNQHVVELMTDPFGNYLCQKLLEYCNDEERTVLIQNAAKDMVRIALNQHGTRALQKMIEFVATPVHVRLIIDALRYQVVELIQDLNGNHVIQKCLNKLGSADSEFIFSAVGEHCIEVGTHRHGCCVLQRCIDHATGSQKVWLIAKITEHTLRLVQDPFGNYVVQYIIDLNEPTFTEPLTQKFFGKIVMLSRHKFSSNVVEKCLRCASDESKDRMIQELLNPTDMERLIKDQFGNYVVQTALEQCSINLKHQLVDVIRPMIPAIRGTPYGRRIATKVQQYDTHSGNNSGQSTPAEHTQGQISLDPNPSRAMSTQSILAPNMYTNGLNGTRAQMTYPTPADITVQNAAPQVPRMGSYQTYPRAVGNQGNGDGAFF
ncbi:ARM repeat-containing protein [Xylaria palmicola]|nr:ARM repeat-containing protein [Xylaria palmicola]